MVDVLEVRNELRKLRELPIQWNNNHLVSIPVLAARAAHDQNTCLVCRRQNGTRQGIELAIRHFGGCL